MVLEGDGFEGNSEPFYGTLTWRAVGKEGSTFWGHGMYITVKHYIRCVAEELGQEAPLRGENSTYLQLNAIGEPFSKSVSIVIGFSGYSSVLTGRRPRSLRVFVSFQHLPAPWELHIGL